MNLSQLNVPKLAHSTHCFGCCIWVSEQADKVEACSIIWSLSVSAARFRSSEHHQYFSSDEPRKSWHNHFDVCLFYSEMLPLLFKVYTKKVVRCLSVSAFFFLFPFVVLFIFVDLRQTLWLCFSASRLFRLFFKEAKGGRSIEIMNYQYRLSHHILFLTCEFHRTRLRRGRRSWSLLCGEHTLSLFLTEAASRCAEQIELSRKSDTGTAFFTKRPVQIPDCVSKINRI